MNRYTLSDINIGMKESFSICLTEDMMCSFKSITGDNNPLHNEVQFAKEKGYSDRVVYGMLTASLSSTLAGVYLPGENSLIREASYKFLKPVYIGDSILVEGEVTSIDERFNVFDMKVTMYNQNNEKVVRGKMSIGVL